MRSSWRAQPSFKSLLIVCLLVLSLLAVGFVATAGARFTGGLMEADTAEHLRESALRVRDGLESYLHLHESAISALSASFRPGAGQSASMEFAAERLEDTARLYPGFLTLLVTDSHGRIVRAIRRSQTSFTPSGTENQWVADREYFRQAKATDNIFVSGVFQGRGLGRDPIVAISAPLRDRAGRFAGVVEGSIDIARIPLVPTYVHHRPMVIAHDAAGRIVFSTRLDIHRPLQSWSPVVISASGAGGELLTISDPGQRDGTGRMIPQWAVRLPVHVAGWDVIACLAVDEIKTEIHRIYRGAAVVLLFLSVLMWLAADMIARSMARPIVSLVREMEQYELSASSKPAGSGGFVAREIAQIQMEFHRMCSRLWDSYTNLKAALRERDETNCQLQELLLDLDRKVTERTAQLAESEARYRQVVEHSEDIIYRSDLNGRLRFHNAAFAVLLGGNAIGRNILSLIDKDCRPDILRRARQQIQERTPLIYLEFSIRRSDGATCWIGQSTQLLLDPAGEVVGFQAIARDVTEKKLAEMALREAEERYALAVRGSNNGIWDWDLRTGRVYYSERWRQMFGIADQQACGGTAEWWQRVHPSDIDALKQDLEQYVKEGSTGLFESEHRIRHTDGTWRWVMTCGAAVRGEKGVALRIAGSATDVTSGKLVDPLTGLPNRLAVVERLEGLMARQREDPGRRFALLFLDLDRFKLINDSLGHLKGDHLLLGVSRRLIAALESSPAAGGLVGRLGGDEFVVILADAAETEEAVLVAKAIQREMEAPFHLDGSLLFASTSIGIAHSDTGLRGMEDILRNADTAMYQAKTEGCGKYRLFDSSMHARAVARLELETDLRRALEADEFVLYYQAQVSLLTGKLAGFEALVRWNHPRRGLLQPIEFIRVAEENGLILPLGRWVLESGCRQLELWNRQFECCRDLSMSINLSALQFSDPSLSTVVSDILCETGLDPSRLHLEITESMVADDPAVAKNVLDLLSQMGVGLEVDDFGTGYSCLSQLHQLPFDTLKIDRSFVKAMDQEFVSQQDGRKIVESIVTLSANLGISVIAEGIETVSNWIQLARLGCQLGQGYYFSRPVSAEEALRLAKLRTAYPWPLPEDLVDSAGGIARLGLSLADLDAENASLALPSAADTAPSA